MSRGAALVVDPCEQGRALITSALHHEGFAVIQAANGPDALARVGERRDIRLVVADLEAPGAEGISLIASLRARPIFHYTPILALTTGEMWAQREGRVAGATGWVAKPLAAGRLRSAVSRVCR